MEKLSDDVLLMVMEYLHVKDIIACRVTCKRLARLSLHPAVWRHQSFGNFGSMNNCLCPVLRTAPCLGSLYLKSQCHLSDLLFTTKCAVEKLIMYLTIPAHEILTIRNQEELGRLRYLELVFPSNNDPADLETFLGRIVDVSGLERLEVSGTLNLEHLVPSPRTTNDYIEASLKRFGWSARVSADREVPTCNIVLGTHAATLETVNIEFMTRYKELATATTTASLLARMPKLRVLQCFALPGLEAVAACESLREVNINVASKDGTDKQAAVKFLQRAAQLRKVQLQRCGEDDGELVLALASSGRSAVESLSYHHSDVSKPVDAKSLLRALPLLPALRHLKLMLDVPDLPDELLTGFTPSTAPALQSVMFSTHTSCIHAWMHRESFKLFLTTNSSIQVYMELRKVCGLPRLCETCSLDCRMHLSNTLLKYRFSQKMDWLSVLVEHGKVTH